MCMSHKCLATWLKCWQYINTEPDAVTSAQVLIWKHTHQLSCDAEIMDICIAMRGIPLHVIAMYILHCYSRRCLLYSNRSADALEWCCS